MKKILIVIVVLIFGCECKSPLEVALHSENPKIKKVMDNLDEHEVQILFTEVLEDESGKVTFKEDSFHVDENTYFYPASSVKFPIALLALEKMNANKNIDINTIFNVEGDSLKTTFTNEINKIFAISDNESYTRLFEYLGQDYIKKELDKRGIKARISHRLSGDNPYDLETKSLYFYSGDSLIFTSEISKNDSIKELKLNKITKGTGYTSGDSLIEKPMNFGFKNYIPLSSLHNLMKQVMFPEAFSEEKRFVLSEENRAFLLKSMRTLPKELNYNSSEYYDSYVKFLVFGDTKEPIPTDIEIYNKVGYAYGYLTDCAFIVNKKTNKKYIITVTIHVNKNKIYNDGIYEYNDVGIPFLAELGRQLVN